MTKKEKQELLEKLFVKEQERMRKKCFKYKRRPLLFKTATIEIASADTADNIGGYYKYEEQPNGTYVHRIYINEKGIDKNIHYKRWNIYNSLLKTIRHELVHAYVNEYFSPLSQIEGIHKDCSDIFISCLIFFDCGTSDHQSNIAYNRKFGWEHKLEMKYWDWDTMFSYIIDSIDKYNQQVKKLNFIVKGNVLYNCTYKFGDGTTCGLDAESKIVSILTTPEQLTDTLGKSYILSMVSFSIGSCVKPEDLEKYTMRKLLNGRANKSVIGNRYLQGKQEVLNCYKLQTKCI